MRSTRSSKNASTSIADADVHVRRPVRAVPEIHDGAAAAQLRLELDLHVAVPCLDEARADQVRHRHRVVDRRSLPAVGLAVVAREVDVQVRDEGTDAAGGAKPRLDVGAEERLMRDVEADHAHVQAAVEHGRGRLRIAPDVELRGRREVPLGDRAAHDDDPPDAVRAVLGEVARDVRQRPRRDDRDRRARRADHCVP